MASIGIMQPYFFPYLGYFALIKHTDSWIVFDPTQYDRKGWMHRNRILKPDPPGGNQYFSVATVKAPRETPISEITVDNRTDWPDRILRQLEHYKLHAPHYGEVTDFLKDCFATRPDSLSELNALYLDKTCLYLGIPLNYRIFSKMDLAIEPPTHPGEWALNICKALGDVDRYINPPGGRAIFRPEQWTEAGIELRFLTVALTPYDQRRDVFEPGLSIIDVMMFNTPQQIRDMLDAVTIAE